MSYCLHNHNGRQTVSMWLQVQQARLLSTAGLYRTPIGCSGSGRLDPQAERPQSGRTPAARLQPPEPAVWNTVTLSEPRYPTSSLSSQDPANSPSSSRRHARGWPSWHSLRANVPREPPAQAVAYVADPPQQQLSHRSWADSEDGSQDGLVPARPSCVHAAAPPSGIQDLEDALNSMHRTGALFFGKYVVLASSERRLGGQGIVQFMRGVQDGHNYATKVLLYPPCPPPLVCGRDDSRRARVCMQFYVHREAFDTELQVYKEQTLKQLMPRRFDVIANLESSLRAPGGYVFPPCIVLERGEPLNEFARNVEHEFITVVQALVVLAKKLQLLHEAGWVHRDLKPGNVLRMPALHSWALIDFGCTARAGASTPRGFC